MEEGESTGFNYFDADYNDDDGGGGDADIHIDDEIETHSANENREE